MCRPRRRGSARARRAKCRGGRWGFRSRPRGRGLPRPTSARALRSARGPGARSTGGTPRRRCSPPRAGGAGSRSSAPRRGRRSRRRCRGCANLPRGSKAPRARCASAPTGAGRERGRTGRGRGRKARPAPNPDAGSRTKAESRRSPRPGARGRGKSPKRDPRLPPPRKGRRVSARPRAAAHRARGCRKG